jgi:hypothetical protein
MLDDSVTSSRKGPASETSGETQAAPAEASQV